MIRTVSASVVFLLFISTIGADNRLSSVKAAEPPSDRVIVMYFHRTVRCPTCQKMGGYAQEAVRTGFAEEMKSGKVELHDVDFQNPANDGLAKGYKVESPTLVVVRVNGNKAAEVRKLTEIWVKVRDKQSFFDYVQSNVRELLK